MPQSWVDINVGGDTMEAYLAQPEATDPGPGSGSDSGDLGS